MRWSRYAAARMPLPAALRRLADLPRRIRSRFLLPGDTEAGGAMLALGAATGLATGLLASALVGVIQAVQTLAFGSDPGTLRVLLAPALGGLLVGLLTRFVPEAGGNGVVQTMSTIALRGGRFRTPVPLGGVAATGLALGTGASGGREGPIVLIGGAVGSLLGRLFAVGEERLRTLVAAGAAAGIGASFNAPVGGMLFALEVIVGGFRTSSLQVIVVASVVGSVTAREIVGPQIIYEPDRLYTLPQSLVPVLVSLALYALLGLASVLAGLALLHGVDVSRRGFSRLRVWPPLRVALGGLGVGLIALALPEVLGTGDNLPPIDGVRQPIQALLNGADAFGTGYGAAGVLLLLAAAKLVASCLSIGSGSAVGSFAPTILIGAALGAAFGLAADTLVTAVDVQPGALALVGTAAVFSAAARAPLTAIVVAFEITGDYELVLPLMLASGIATFVADRVQPLSIYTFPLRKRGIVYAEPEDVDIMQTVSVGEIMTTDHPRVPADLPLDQLHRYFGRGRSHGFPVVQPGTDRLVGVVAASDLARAEAADEQDRPRTAGEVATRRPATVTPTDPVFRALRRMAALDVGRLPVVASEDHGRLVGFLRRADVVKAYQRAMTRSLGVQHRRASSRLRELSGTTFVELVVDPQAPVAGAAVRDVQWPERTILTSVRRHGEVVMPNGSTVLQPGDELVVLTGGEQADAVRGLLIGEDTDAVP